MPRAKPPSNPPRDVPDAPAQPKPASAAKLADPRQTPAMQQWTRFKKRYPDCVLLFRMGDFYETFDDDAVTVSKALGLTLTQRTAGVPMAGVPFHQLDTYLRRLVAQGYRVAVGEQLQDASLAKGVVPRAVTRVVTPGMVVDDALLESDAASTLGCVIVHETERGDMAFLAVVDLSTGAFRISDMPAASLVDELSRAGVRELLYPEPVVARGVKAGSAKPHIEIERALRALSISGTLRPGWHFRQDESREALLSHYGVKTLAGFGLRDADPVVGPAGAILRYIKETQTLSEEDTQGLENAPGVHLARVTLGHIRPPTRVQGERFCIIDAVTLRSLEIERTMRAGAGVSSGGTGADRSLVGCFLGGTGEKSCSKTPMGRRLLAQWLVTPLREVAAIEARQRVVACLVEDRVLAERLGEELGAIQDVARIAGRLSLGRSSPRDVVGLARSLTHAPALADLLDAPATRGLRDRLVNAAAATEGWARRVVGACVESPPAHLREGGLFVDGFDTELDECRLLERDAGSWLSAYQARLIEEHDLPSLKVGYNRVFGYYIELPQAQARSAPAALTRTQTLKNAERFTTPELREFEQKVTSARSRGLERERVLLAGVCDEALALLESVLDFAEAVAELDALGAFAQKAQRKGWVRPEVVQEAVLDIEQGRHPVLDDVLGTGFVPNDARLGTGKPGDSNASLALLTGPNMAGKSTFIRQTALLALLALTGSFVPAKRATVGVIDRIFTRIGADDALHAGQSTFMVEMIETANILNHATPRSLVVLDEIGRGTSTLDGLSLAWAIAEHLAGTGDAFGPRTLFATHYHELTDLEERLAGRVKNLHVLVREWPPGDPQAQIVFLHRIKPGKTDQSYGVHVARLAGVPTGVIERAREVLGSLAVHHGPMVQAPLGRDEAAGSVGGATPRSGRSAKPRGALKVPSRETMMDHPDDAGQMSLFTRYVSHPVVEELREVKIDSLTPLRAFDLLREIVGRVHADESSSNTPPKD
ncbi:MAG: DNA mismatch repair protein MutS [Phycisphaerales bacterium]|nr:MAG: DNA mismatch repair protein MutS [Phycisphaerales bacterium]